MNIRDKISFSTRPGVRVTLDPDGDKCHIVNEHVLPGWQLDQIKARCEASAGRSALGDSLQFHGELPFSLVQKFIPMDAWEDEKAWARLFNSSEFRAFTTGRKL